jgi:hypothetical protein
MKHDITSKWRLFIKTLLLNGLVILLFATSYFYNQKGFILTYGPKRKIEFLDCLFTATTVQASVGVSNLMPIAYTAQWLMILHQFVMILSHITAVAFFIFL